MNQQPPIQKDILCDTHPNITQSDLKQLGIFGILYVISGIPMGLITGIHILLAANHATKSMQACLAFCRIPFGFKLLFATLIDSFYLTQFGKRKTYIIPSIYIIGMLLFTLGYYDIQNCIHQLEISPILILMFFAILIDGILIIAINGWALSAITQQFIHLSGTSLMIGQNLGHLLGYTIMCNLTSDYFSKQILGLSEIIISLNAYLIVLGITTIMIGIVIQIACKEKSIKSDSILSQPQQFLYNLKRFCIVLKNKNVQFFLLFLLTRRIPHAASTASFSIDLVSYGFPQSQYSLLSLFAYVSIVFGSFIVGKYMKKGTEMTWTFNTYYGLYIGSIIKVLFISTLKYMGGYNSVTYLLLVILHVIGDLPNYIQDTTISCFLMGISDPNIGGTYTALLICAFELGYALSETLSLLLLNYIPYLYLAVGGYILGLNYLIFLHEPLIHLQKLGPQSWKVEEIM